MKLSIALLGMAASAIGASDIHADSALGKSLLSNARRLDGGEDAPEWVAGYSLKFQGCHHITGWNSNADEEEDVRMATKRLVRFRLCPTESCSASKGGGCSSGYGDYVLSLGDFVSAYYENKKQQDEYECEQFKDANCDCENDDDGGDADEECEYDCFMDAEMYTCIDGDEEDGEDEFDMEDYMECAQLGGGDEDEEDEEQENRQRRRKLDDGVAYYIGPYCENQGGSIYMGLFLDDTCSEFADSGNGAKTFEKLTGQSLPYSSESLINADCISCVEQQDNDEGDGDGVSEMCGEIYQSAGKCEENLPQGMTDENNNACTYIEGIKVAREDGILNTSTRPSKVATFFIVIFAIMFALLVFYVWYLRMRLGIKKNRLS